MSEINDLVESYYNDVYIEEEQLDEIAISGTRSSVPGARTKSQLMGNASRVAPPAPKLPSPAQADRMDAAAGRPSRFTAPAASTSRPLPAGAPKLGLKVTSPAGAKVAPSAAPSAKPAGSAMDQWAAANPKLAAAKAERDRTRGTSATTNPLMKDMKSSLPTPTSPSPTTVKTGFDLSKKGIDLSKK